MGGTYDPPERNDDQNDDLKAGRRSALFYAVAFFSSYAIFVFWRGLRSTWVKPILGS
jgi:hypothetical protein